MTPHRLGSEGGVEDLPYQWACGGVWEEMRLGLERDEGGAYSWDAK